MSLKELRKNSQCCFYSGVLMGTMWSHATTPAQIDDYLTWNLRNDKMLFIEVLYRESWDDEMSCNSPLWMTPLKWKSLLPTKCYSSNTKELFCYCNLSQNIQYYQTLCSMQWMMVNAWMGARCIWECSEMVHIKLRGLQT